MPLTEGLRPGKFVSVLGQPQLDDVVGPTYNGDLNQYAGNNANSNAQFKVFQKDGKGGTMSQNLTLINQDIYDTTQNNADLRFGQRNRQRFPETYEEKYDLIASRYQIEHGKPRRSPLHPS